MFLRLMDGNDSHPAAELAKQRMNPYAMSQLLVRRASHPCSFYAIGLRYLIDCWRHDAVIDGSEIRFDPIKSPTSAL